MLRGLAAVFLGLALAMQLAAGASAETRVALVIGNAAYKNAGALPNSINDANLIAGALKADGFGVTVASNLGRDAFLKTLRAFQDQADASDWAVVYYAGHGIEMAGTNYLIPVDAKLAQDRDVPDETISLDRVLTAIEGAKSLHMVVLDACRNNPFLSTMKRNAGAGRDIGRGLALVEPTQATLIAYSARVGTIAADGTGANSPFAIALAKHIVEPGVEVDKMFRLVRDDVLAATARKQEPFVNGSLPGQDFFFRSPAVASNAPRQGEPPQRVVPGTPTKIGSWMINDGRDSQTGKFNGCFATATYNSGITMLLIMSPEGLWTMGFGHPKWALTQTDSINISLVLDNGAPITTTAIVSGPQQILVSLRDKPALAEPFRRAKQLEVITPGQTLSFSLTDTSKVLPALTKCVNDNTVGAANPFGGQPAKQ